MKKACPLFILFFLLSVLAFAQDYKGKGRVLGFVYDEQGNPLEGVKIKLFSLKAQQRFEVVSDKEGKWVASWIIGGGWNVDFEKFGYLPKKIAIEVDEYKRNPEIVINLKKAEGLVVTEEIKAELTKGNQLFDEKKYDEARAVYEGILATNPDAYIINKNIGNCYFQQDKYDQAEEYYQKVLEKDPNNAAVILLIGNCYANQGQNEKALEWYAKINLEKIDDATILYNVGTIYYNHSKFEEALKYYKKAAEIQKDFPDGLYQLGLTYLTLGNYPESIAAFEHYLQIDPDSERAGQVKGFLEFLKKKVPV
jgi:tetratricopeptide (TPR) repeat protein